MTESNLSQPSKAHLLSRALLLLLLLLRAPRTSHRQRPHRNGSRRHHENDSAAAKNGRVSTKKGSIITTGIAATPAMLAELQPAAAVSGVEGEEGP
eukprot:1480375-Rhodomonas_salina.2